MKKPKGMVDKSIKHQVAMRGQFTRIARTAFKYLDELKFSIKSLFEREAENKNWSMFAKLRKSFATADNLISDQYNLIGKSIARDLVDIAEYEAMFTSKMFGVKFKFDDIDRNTIDSLVNQDPFDGKILSEWLNDQKVATQTKIKQTVRLGIVNGLSTNDIVHNLINSPDSPFETSKRNAHTLVRTAAAHVTAKADMLGFKNAGIEKYQISAVLDTRTTPICAALDKMVFSVNDPDAKMPPFHPNCRSTMIAYLDDEDLVGESFESWLVKQPEDDQIKVLGTSRQKMWKSGLPIDRFVDLDNMKVVPLAQLAQEEGVRMRDF